MSEIKVDKNSKKKLNKYILYIILIVGLTAFVLGVSLSGETSYNGENLPTIIVVGKMFSTMNIGYIFLFIGLLFLYYLLSSFCLFLFARLYTKKYKFHQAMSNQMVGSFYNYICPGGFYSGGQFAQAITFKRQGVNISNAASVLVMQFIMFQICLLLLGLISLFKIDKVLNIGIITIGNSFEIPIVLFIILGFLLNAIIIITILLVSHSHRFHNFVLNHGVNLLYKLHIITDLEKKRDQYRIQIENFRIELRRLQSNIPFTILLFIITMLILCIYDSFPYVVGLSLNAFANPSEDIFNRIFESIAFTNYHQMICGIIPIPGNAGISEFIFTSLFSNYYDPSFVNSGIKASMLLWRMLTYYIPLLISAIFAVFYRPKGTPKTEERFYSLERSTFVTLQIEAFNHKNLGLNEEKNVKTLETKNIESKLKKDDDVEIKVIINKEEKDENRDIH